MARNFALLLLGEMAGQVVAFLVTAHLARALGPGGFGIWTFAVSVIVYLTVVVDAGTEAWGMREVSTRPARLRPAVAGVVGLRLALAGLAAAAVVTLAAAGAFGPERGWALAFGAVSLLGFALNPAWALRGIEVAAPVAAANLLQRLVFAGLAVALVGAPGDVRYTTLWQGVADLAAAGLCLAALVPHGGLPWRAAFRLARAWAVLRRSWPMGASRALRGAMSTAGVVVLAYTWPDAVVGEFGAALRLALGLLLVSSIFGLVVLPATARACRRGGPEEAKVVTATFHLLGTLLVPLCVGLAVLAEPVLALVFGPGYAAAALPLRILMAMVVVMGLSDNLRRVLQARHRQGLDLRLVVAAAVVGLAVTGPTVWFGGAAGAAAAMLAGESVLMILAAVAVRRTGPSGALAASLAGPALAAAVMAAGVLLLRHLSLAVSVPAGAAIYAAMLLLWRRRLLADLHRLEGGGSLPAGRAGEVLGPAGERLPPTTQQKATR
ncbi:MAG: oligosaccharide flippase family protein [Acetobacteraceae bacterium]|nr:oligosaccharide flippase family protein [Acetobacteraceae bacterium]